MITKTNMSIAEKLSILSDAAKFDVACTSSGVNRNNNGSGLGNSKDCGICHTFSADGRCVSLLKILFTNECIFDCKYCINRSSNDVIRASFTPEEVANLTIEFYRRNYIEGLFLSSGIIRNPNHTSELLYETLRLLRVDYKFNGYIHIKTIPGTDDELIDRIGWFADRMSINLELPTGEGLRTLAPHKSRKNILTPMRHIQNNIGMKESKLLTDKNDFIAIEAKNEKIPDIKDNESNIWKPKNTNRIYVPAGQSTQMIIGATNESDYQIMNVTEGLYNNFNLKRVFYSAYVDVNRLSNLPSISDKPPLLREHRLYQADWLLRYYGFSAKELLSEDKPNFNIFIDPKCDWAVRHLEIFPVEINRASYSTLLRVPGIGVKSAKRIIQARKHSKLDFDALKKLGVVLKRALYFITCSGKTMYSIKMNENFIVRNLLDLDKDSLDKMDSNVSYKQLSLFDDKSFADANSIMEVI